MTGSNSPKTFVDSLSKHIRQAKTSLCAGIDFRLTPNDTHSAILNELNDNGARALLEKLSCIVLDVCAAKVGAVKFQSAFFEVHGAEGWAALDASIKNARARGIFTILDAKRSDIGSTMRAYGAMAFSTLNVDALTVVPYLGIEVMSSLRDWLKEGKGIYLVWQSSNMGAHQFQDPILDVILEKFSEYAQSEKIPHSFGLVLGATKLDTLDARLFTKVLNLPLLLPGFGAQGAVWSKRTALLQDDSDQCLFPVSRGLVNLKLDGFASDAKRGWEAFLASSIETTLEELNKPFLKSSPLK